MIKNIIDKGSGQHFQKLISENETILNDTSCVISKTFLNDSVYLYAKIPQKIVLGGS